MKLTRLLSGLALAISLAALSGCGSKCDSKSCKGCCTADGKCETGNVNNSCGTAGVACQDCAKSSKACVSNACQAINAAGGACTNDAGCQSGLRCFTAGSVCLPPSSCEFTGCLGKQTCNTTTHICEDACHNSCTSPKTCNPGTGQCDYPHKVGDACTVTAPAGSVVDSCASSLLTCDMNTFLCRLPQGWEDCDPAQGCATANDCLMVAFSTGDKNVCVPKCATDGECGMESVCVTPAGYVKNPPPNQKYCDYKNCGPTVAPDNTPFWGTCTGGRTCVPRQSSNGVVGLCERSDGTAAVNGHCTPTSTTDLTKVCPSGYRCDPVSLTDGVCLEVCNGRAFDPAYTGTFPTKKCTDVNTVCSSADAPGCGKAAAACKNDGDCCGAFKCSGATPTAPGTCVANAAAPDLDPGACIHACDYSQGGKCTVGAETNWTCFPNDMFNHPPAKSWCLPPSGSAKAELATCSDVPFITSQDCAPGLLCMGTQQGGFCVGMCPGPTSSVAANKCAMCTADATTGKCPATATACSACPTATEKCSIAFAAPWDQQIGICTP